MSKKTGFKKRYIIIPLVALLLLGGAGTGYWVLRKRNADSVASHNYVNYDKPTKAEQQAGDDQKAKNVSDQEAQEKNTPTPQPGQTAPATTANLVLADASQYGETVEVRAYASNVYEDGSCTAVFSKQGQASITTTSQAFKDASTTQCGANDTMRSRFTAAGDWNMTITYTSTSGIKGSVSKTVTIK